MIPQLVAHRAQVLVTGGATPEAAQAQAQTEVITADPFDLLLRMEQLWDAANLGAPNPPPAGVGRRSLFQLGAFSGVPFAAQPAWDHLLYSYAIENSRAAQILTRVVRGFRSGEGLGIPSLATQRWLDVTETLLAGAHNPLAPWLTTSAVRPDPEGVRRNAYFRLFGMDLAHGTDGNAPFPFDKAEASNRTFVQLFEELLFELWRAIENIRNMIAGNTTDDDRIYRLAEQLSYMLRTRRQNTLLGREELSAATAMGWVELTLISNTPVVIDLRAQATSAGDRLRVVGERVGLPPHSRAGSFFSMASELSMLLRALEGNWIVDNTQSWLLYQSTTPPMVTPLVAGARPLGTEVRRVITEWAAASGRDLKARSVPTQVAPTPALARR